MRPKGNARTSQQTDSEKDTGQLHTAAIRCKRTSHVHGFLPCESGLLVSVSAACSEVLLQLSLVFQMPLSGTWPRCSLQPLNQSL